MIALWCRRRDEAFMMTSQPLRTCEAITDDELATLALAADADAPLGDDAVSIYDVIAPPRPGPLPTWYMPAAVSAPALSGWRKHLVACGVFLPDRIVPDDHRRRSLQYLRSTAPLTAPQTRCQGTGRRPDLRGGFT
jgi:hypothetical protein